METEREMSRYEVSPIGIFLETWDDNGGIKRECLIPRDCFVEAYEKWIKNAPTEKNEESIIKKIRDDIEKEIVPRDSDKYDITVMWQNMGLRIALKIINDNMAKK